MNKIKDLLTMGFLLTTILGFGQNDLPKTEEQPFSEISGTAEKQEYANRFYIFMD